MVLQGIFQALLEKVKHDILQRSKKMKKTNYFWDDPNTGRLVESCNNITYMQYVPSKSWILGVDEDFNIFTVEPIKIL